MVLVRPDMERPVNLEGLVLVVPSGLVDVGHADLAAAEAAVATVDHSDMRGSSRIIVIRRELPRTIDAGSVRRPAA